VALGYADEMPPSKMRRVALVVCLWLGGSASAWAAEYHVATTGSDGNAGTAAAPFATLGKANAVAAGGDTVWVHGGTYYLTSQLVLSKSGTSDGNRTKIWAVAGEVPVFDASRYVTSNAAVDVPVVLVTGSWMHLRGLTIANAKVGASGDHSYSLLRTKNASNNIFELLDLHHGFGPGLFVDTGTGGNLILNCDSHDNYDKDGSQGDGQNGDGFGVHYQETGPSTIIRGCRAWNDADDGYDLISQEVPVTIEDSYAWSNGHGADGNGNGFKVGSSQTGVRHLVQNNVAWKNKAAGFYANHSTGGNTWLNNTSYQNGVQYNMLASPPGDSTMTIVLTGTKVHRLHNNIGFPNKNTNMSGVETSFNTWDLGLAEAASDFVSTTDEGCAGPRQANGAIPASCAFMRLKAGSPLIDKGTDVGLPFVGAAPDLGAYEFGAGGTTGGDTGGSAGGGRGGGSGATGGASAGAGGAKVGTGGVAGTGGAGGRTGGVSGSGGRATGGTSSTGGTDARGGAAAGAQPASTGGGQATGGAGAKAGGATGGADAEDAGGEGCQCGLSRNGAGQGGALAALLMSVVLVRRPRPGKADARRRL